MATLRNVSSKLRGAVEVGTILIAIAVGIFMLPFLMSCEDTAEAGPTPAAIAREQRELKRAEEAAASRQRREARKQASEAQWERIESESQERREALEAEVTSKAAVDAAKREKRRRVQRLKRARALRWLIKSPAAIREALWNVPREGGDKSVSGALQRICISEAGWLDPELDCVWIWQVVQNIRARTCKRGDYRNITECDENGETDMSAMRRLSGRVLDEGKARTERQRWISRLLPTCERPVGFPRGDNWERHLKRHCDRIASEVKAITQLKANRNLTNGAIPIAWGGRCEVSEGACDDQAACDRGLARIPSGKTHNAYWCRPKSPGCRATIDPICTKGVKAGSSAAPAKTLDDESH